MANLMTCAAMGNDDLLRPRIAAAIVALAIDVIAEPALTDTANPVDRAAQARRRSYALAVTEDVTRHALRAQWALACWRGSNLADTYALGGAAAITDEQLATTLAAVWTATGGA